MKEFFKPTREKLIVFIILAIVNIFLTFEAILASYGFLFFKQVVLNINLIPVLVLSLVTGLAEPVLFRFVDFIIVSLIYWYVISCCAVYLYNRFKKRPKVLGSIVLVVIILIVVPAFLMVYPGYQDIELPTHAITILNGFCTGGNTANVIIKNVGKELLLDDIVVMNTITGTPASGEWYTIDGTQPLSTLNQGETGKFNATCSGYCTYRFILGGPPGGIPTISVACYEFFSKANAIIF